MAVPTAIGRSEMPWSGVGKQDAGIVDPLGRIGLAARGVVYVIVAWLALLVATDKPHPEADRQGALATIASQPFGSWLLVVLAVAFAGYAAWRVAEAVTGRTSTDRDAGPGRRALSAFKALLYGAFAVSTLQFALTHRSKGGANQQQGWTAKVLGWPFGRQLVFAIGAAIVVAGLYNLWNGATGHFMRKIKRGELGDAEERTVRIVGGGGYVGRGVAFVLVGLFIVQAALDFDPDKSRGLDGALQTVAARSYGPACLVVLAVGLCAFGIYSFAEARWRRLVSG